MDEKQLQALANELDKNLKTPEDLSQFARLLKKISVEAALNAEISHHLGYDKNSLNRVLTPATVIPQRPLPPAMVPWNYVLLTIVMALSNHNW